MSVYLQFEFKIDTAKDGTFDTDISDRVTRFDISYGMMDAYGEIGAPPQMMLSIDNKDWAFNQDDSSAPYYGMIAQGLLVRLRVFYGGTWYTRFIGWIQPQAVLPMGRTDTTRAISLTVSDASHRLSEMEYIPPLETSVTTDGPLTTMFDSGIVFYPYESSYFILDASALDSADVLYGGTSNITDFETGQTTLDYAGDVPSGKRGAAPMALINEMLIAEAGGRFYYDPKQPAYVFHSRWHDIEYSGSIQTLTTEQHISSISYRQSPIFNSASVSYEPRTIGSAGSTLYDSPAVPMLLGTQQIRTITMRYQNPDVPTSQTSATAVIFPVQGTDVVGNSRADGAGTNRSTDIGYSADIGAQSAQIVLHNQSDTPLYITKLAIRGTPLTRQSVQVAEYIDAPSIRQYNSHPKPLVNAGAIADPVVADNYARKIVGRFKDAATEVNGVAVIASYNDANASLALPLDIGDQITVTDQSTTHNAVYVIVGIRESRDTYRDGMDYVLSYVLKPKSRERVFLLDTSSLDGVDLLAF